MTAMNCLREKMARHGFESNDDYEFQVRCLLESATSTVRTLNITGDCERRKTAFANALAHALDAPHVMYHDFTQEHPPIAEVILPPSRDELGREAPPIEPLDDTVSEACARSEADETILILDQIQAADFREHIRVHRLIRDGHWDIRDARYYANPRHLILFLISEEPLYHSLQTDSFRVWVNRASERRIDYNPADFGLGPDAVPLFHALKALFQDLDSAPTRGEFEKILQEIDLRVRTRDQLRICLYGWTEDLERTALYDQTLLPALDRVVARITDYLGAEHIEVGGAPEAMIEMTKPE